MFTEQSLKSLCSELFAVGVTIEGIDADGNISWVTEPKANDIKLAELVLKAHETKLASAEAVKLQTALGDKSVEWAAYCEARKKDIKEKREQRYRLETDAIRMQIDDDYDVGSKEWMDAITEWRALRAKIRDELPYPE